MTSIYPPRPNQTTTGNPEKPETNVKKDLTFITTVVKVF